MEALFEMVADPETIKDADGPRNGQAQPRGMDVPAGLKTGEERVLIQRSFPAVCHSKPGIADINADIPGCPAVYDRILDEIGNENNRQFRIHLN